MKLKERMARWLYPEIKKRDEAEMLASSWSRTIEKCRHCERPLYMECVFCPHCGRVLEEERHTTGQIRLASVVPPSSQTTVTGVIKAWQKPGDRHAIQALARARKEQS